MALEDVLRQHAEIADFLKSLVVVHKRALQEQNLSLQLPGIRKDIYICFNDLCKLNEMLIACDGEIKETIEMFKASKEKFAKLIKKESALVEEKKEWSLEAPQISTSRIPVTIESGYRSLLNRYIELVGATNTSLVDGQNHDGVTERGQLTGSMALLQACNDEVARDIKQLEALLRDFKKDQAFVSKELRNNQGRIRHEIYSIDESLTKVEHSKKKLLAKVGLAIPDTQGSFLSQTLFNLQLNEEQTRKMQEQDDIANHATEFIDMKIQSLQDQLTHKKEDSSSLLNQRNLWGECIQAVEDLENRLDAALNNEHNLPAGQIMTWLKDTISELNTAIAVCDSEILKTLVTDEKEIIEKALREISLEAAQPLNIPKISRHPPLPSSPSHSHSSPPFLVASKSPPKIGVTDETVDPAAGGNAIELEEIDYPKRKQDKRD